MIKCCNPSKKTNHIRITYKTLQTKVQKLKYLLITIYIYNSFVYLFAATEKIVSTVNLNHKSIKVPKIKSRLVQIKLSWTFGQLITPFKMENQLQQVLN